VHHQIEQEAAGEAQPPHLRGDHVADPLEAAARVLAQLL
jgi:hypothetical protein